MGVEVLKLIILGHLLGVTDNFQDHHVPAMRENKGLLVAQGAVKGEIQLIGILIDTFFLPLYLWGAFQVLRSFWKAARASGFTRTK